MNQTITIHTDIHASMKHVWDCWTNPKHITHWTFASDDWEAPFAENDLRVGGKFLTRMSAKDKSAGFDFGGTYTTVKEYESIEYEMNDGRRVSISFIQLPDAVRVVETFDMEQLNSEEQQRAGWQSILDQFKTYTESQSIKKDG